MSLIERAFRERIVLVGVTLPPNAEDDTEASLDELALLGRHRRRRRGRPASCSAASAPDPTYFVGKGKAEELRELSLAVDADTVVFDDELTPAQQFNLEKLLGRTAIDRTAVILDIFAQNAHSHEGKAQVELAQLRYRLPRLRRGASANSPSRPAASAPACAARARPSSRSTAAASSAASPSSRRELRDLGRTRKPQRKSRGRSGLQNVAIVGYTNAGKSTLLNRLTDAGVLVEDRLFATLDATTRRLELPGGEPVLLTDTVGFVRKLPHQLVEAFKSTLEVVAEADLLVHVVDATAPDPEAQIDAVRTVLAEIGAERVPELLVFNKADLAAEEANRAGQAAPGLGGDLGPHRRGDRAAAAAPSATGCGR